LTRPATANTRHRAPLRAIVLQREHQVINC
jgi:hypothetical protein